jgi:Potassium-transporting ATPase A subunit
VDLFSATQYLLFLTIVTVLVKPLGGHMERVFSRKKTVLDRLCLPVESVVYRFSAIDPDVEMTGKEYATCFILFGFVGTLLLYALLRLRQFLPWFFPQYQTTPMSPDLALNTAISFSTTTTWQAYAGENTMSYFSQLLTACLTIMVALSYLPALALGPRTGTTAIRKMNPLSRRAYVSDAERTWPKQQIAVLAAELVQRHWYHHVLHNKRAAVLMALLPRQWAVVINIPWYLESWLSDLDHDRRRPRRPIAFHQ